LEIQIEFPEEPQSFDSFFEALEPFLGDPVTPMRIIHVREVLKGILSSEIEDESMDRR